MKNVNSIGESCITKAVCIPTLAKWSGAPAVNPHEIIRAIQLLKSLWNHIVVMLINKRY